VGVEDLSVTEAELWNAFPRAETVDLRVSNGGQNDPGRWRGVGARAVGAS